MVFLIVLCIGLVFGSFIACASYRLPRGENLVAKPSCCPACKTKLKPKDLWPVLSWVTSKGTCRHCGAKVHWRYPAIELATAAVFVAIYWRYGFNMQAVILALMAVALLIMTVVDFEHYIIPDEIHWALLPLGIAYHYTVSTPIDNVILGTISGAAIGLALHYGYRLIRKKEGLGFGDVKFFMVSGLWLSSLVLFPPFLFLSGMLGVGLGIIWQILGRGPRFPFGPALALALFLCVAFPETTRIFWRMFDLDGF